MIKNSVKGYLRQKAVVAFIIVGECMLKTAQLISKFIFCTLALANYIHAAEADHGSYIDIINDAAERAASRGMLSPPEAVNNSTDTSHEQNYQDEEFFALCHHVQEICEPYLKNNKDYKLHKKDLKRKEDRNCTDFGFLSNVCYQLTINEEVDSSVLQQIVMTGIPTKAVFQAFVAVRCHNKGQLTTSKALFLQERVLVMQEENNKELFNISVGSWVNQWAVCAQDTDNIYRKSFTGGSVSLPYCARLGDEWRQPNGYFSPDNFLKKLAESSCAFVFTHIEKEQIQRTASVWISAFLQVPVRQRLASLLKEYTSTPETVFLQKLSDTAASITLPIVTQQEFLTEKIRSAPMTPLPSQRVFAKLAHAILHPDQVKFDEDEDEDVGKKLKKDQEEAELQTAGKSEKELEELRKLQLKTQKIQCIKKIFKAFYRGTTPEGYEIIYKGWEEALPLPEHLEEGTKYKASQKFIDDLWEAFDKVPTYVSPTQWASVVHHLKKIPQLSRLSETHAKTLFAYKEAQDSRPLAHAVQTKKDYYDSNYGVRKRPKQTF